MEINITDEMIEKMVREQVKEIVNQYFGKINKEDSFFMVDNIKSAIRVCAQEEIEKIANEEFMKKICSDLAKTNLKDMIIESFATRIASAFGD